VAGAIAILILLCAGLSHKLAKDRRRRSAFWVTMAALIGPTGHGFADVSTRSVKRECGRWRRLMSLSRFIASRV